MRKLHVVGVSEDGGTLVLADAPDAPGAYTAPVEDRLRAALRRPVRRTTGAGRGSLTPREIQARLRAGAELADVAAEAGLPPERLEAYAAPVLSERARVLEDARAARMSRPQLGPSAVPLAVAVGQRLRALLGGPPEAVRWSASRAEDASWTVQFSYAADGANGTAAWRWDRSAHSLTPLNRAAAELGHVPRHAERPVPDAAPVPRGSGATPAAVQAGGPHAGTAANTGPAAVSALPASGGRPAGQAPTGPHRADGTQGPSRVEDLQVDAAQAPTVAVLSPPVPGAGGDPAPRLPAAAAGPVAVQAPGLAAQAPAAQAPATPAAAAAAPTVQAPAAPPVAAAAPAAAEPPAAPAAVAEVPAAATAAEPELEPAPAAAAAPAEGPRPEPAPTPAPQPVQPRDPVKARARTARRAAVPTWADVLLGTTPSDQRDAQSPDPGAATG